MTEYRVGDIVVVEDEMRKIQTVIIAEILTNKSDTVIRYGDIIKYRGYESVDLNLVIFAEKQVVSYGEPKDIITDVTITRLLDSYITTDLFFKCVSFHLLRTTDKYDLQILNKCNQLKAIPYMNDNGNVQEILDKMKLKIQINSLTIFSERSS